MRNSTAKTLPQIPPCRLCGHRMPGFNYIAESARMAAHERSCRKERKRLIADTKKLLDLLDSLNEQ